MVTRGRGGAKNVLRDRRGRTCMTLQRREIDANIATCSSSFEELSSSRKPTQSTSIQMDLRVVYRMKNDVGRRATTDAGTPTRVRRDDREADVDAQEKRTAAVWQTPPAQSAVVHERLHRGPRGATIVREEHSTTSLGFSDHSSQR